MRDQQNRRQTGLFRASNLLSTLTGKNVVGGGGNDDFARFDFDGSVADVDTNYISESTGFPVEARGCSLFVWRPGKRRDD